MTFRSIAQASFVGASIGFFYQLFKRIDAIERENDGRQERFIKYGLKELDKKIKSLYKIVPGNLNFGEFECGKVIGREYVKKCVLKNECESKLCREVDDLVAKGHHLLNELNPDKIKNPEDITLLSIVIDNMIPVEFARTAIGSKNPESFDDKFQVRPNEAEITTAVVVNCDSENYVKILKRCSYSNRKRQEELNELAEFMKKHKVYDHYKKHFEQQQ